MYQHHILIYGICDPNLKIIEPFQEYYNGDIRFVGFEYSRIDRLFENYTGGYDKLLISGSTPSQLLIDLWNETYPNIESAQYDAKSYALIKGTREYSFGKANVCFGYWINTNDLDVLDSIHEEVNGDDNINGINLRLLSVEHNMYNYVPTGLFYGVVLDELPNEDEDDNEFVATCFNKLYVPVPIPSRSDIITYLVNKFNIDDPKKLIISDKSELVVIETVCHCCS